MSVTSVQSATKRSFQESRYSVVIYDIRVYSRIILDLPQNYCKQCFKTCKASAIVVIVVYSNCPPCYLIAGPIVVRLYEMYSYCLKCIDFCLSYIIFCQQNLGKMSSTLNRLTLTMQGKHKALGISQGAVRLLRHLHGEIYLISSFICGIILGRRWPTDDPKLYRNF